MRSAIESLSSTRPVSQGSELPTYVKTEEETSNTRKRGWSKCKKLTFGFFCFLVGIIGALLIYLKEVGISTSGEGSTILSVHIAEVSPQDFKADIQLSLFVISPHSVSVPSFPITLSVEGDTFITVNIPAITSLDYGVNILQLNGVVAAVTDKTVLPTHFPRIMGGEEITVRVSGVATAYAPFPVRVNIEKVLHLSLSSEGEEESSGYSDQFKVEDIKYEGMGLFPPSGTVSFVVDAYNPSVLSVADLGPLATDIVYEDKYVAFGMSMNYTMPLVRGWNKFKFELTVEPQFRNLLALGRMLTKLIKQEEMEVTFSGRPDSTKHALLKKTVEQFKYTLTVPAQIDEGNGLNALSLDAEADAFIAGGGGGDEGGEGVFLAQPPQQGAGKEREEAGEGL